MMTRTVRFGLVWFGWLENMTNREWAGEQSCKQESWCDDQVENCTNTNSNTNKNESTNAHVNTNKVYK